MKKSLLISILFLYVVHLQGVWLPSTVKIRLLYPLYESLKDVDILEISLQSFSSTADTLISLAGNISFSESEIENIQQTNIKSSVIMLFREMLESSSLAEKNEYLSCLSEYKEKIGSGLYIQCSNITEQIYSYRTAYNEWDHKLPGYQDSTTSMNARILKLVQLSETNLKKIGLKLQADPTNLNRLIRQYSKLKSKISRKTNLLSRLKNTLEIKSSDIDNLQKNLITMVSNIGEQASGMTNTTGTNERLIGLGTNEMLAGPGTNEKLIGSNQNTISDSQLQDIQNLAKQMMELSMSYLNDEMRKGILYLQSDEPEKAAEIFKKEMIRDPLSWMAYKYMAKIYLKQGKYNKGLEAINKALELFKKAMGIK